MKIFLRTAIFFKWNLPPDQLVWLESVDLDFPHKQLYALHFPNFLLQKTKEDDFDSHN